MANAKIWLICVLLYVGLTMPHTISMYFPNNAQESIEFFLQQNILGDNFTTIDNQMDQVWSFFICQVFIGNMIGGFLMVPLADKLGRRKTLLMMLFLKLPGNFLQSLAKPLDLWLCLYVGRFWEMLCLGVTDLTLQVFVCEIAPPQNRGSLGSLASISISVGALLSVTLGLEPILGSADLWPLGFTVTLPLSMLSLLVLLWVPESPVFLASRSKLSELKNSLQFYHGSEQNMGSVLADKGLDCKQHCYNCSTWANMFAKSELRKPIAIAVLLSVIRSVGFSSSIASFSTGMLHETGFTEKMAQITTVSLFGLGLVSAFLCMYLVERAGRRTLLLCSVSGTALCWLTMVLAAHLNSRPKLITVASALFASQLFSTVGIRSLVPVVVPEIFPYHFRASGRSLARLVTSSTQVLIAYVFWPLFRYSQSIAFGILAVILCASLVVLVPWFPETKKKLPSEIFGENSSFLQDDAKLVNSKSNEEQR